MTLFSAVLCRVCLKPDKSDGSNRVFTSLFDGDGEIAEKFQLISGIEIPTNEHAMICASCLGKLNAAYDLREQMITAEEVHFESIRYKNLPPMQETLNINFDISSEVDSRTTKLTGDELNDSSDSLLVEVDAPQQSQDVVWINSDTEAAAGGNETLKSKARKESTARSRRSRKHIKTKLKNQCMICFNHFTTKHNLYVHGISMHSSGDFKCDVCFKQFTKKSTLVRHGKLHQDPDYNPLRFYLRPFGCTVLDCVSDFYSKSGLQEHMKRYHKTDIEL